MIVSKSWMMRFRNARSVRWRAQAWQRANSLDFLDWLLQEPFPHFLKNRNRAQIPLLFDSHPLIILVSHLRWDEQVIWSDVVCTLPVTWNPPPWPCTCQHLLSWSCVGLIDRPFYLLQFHQHGLGPLLIVPSFHQSTWITELFSFWMDQYNSWISLSLLLDLKTCGWLRQACAEIEKS